MAGQVVLTGRAKDTIVLTSGENVEPEPIEQAVLQSPYIRQVQVLYASTARRESGGRARTHTLTAEALAQLQRCKKLRIVI
jgi:acyl-CoA synthetase (AMP-forming)/AMP-acid ligase II